MPISDSDVLNEEEVVEEEDKVIFPVESSLLSVEENQDENQPTDDVSITSSLLVCEILPLAST